MGENQVNELSSGQHLFKWKIFTQKGVCLWIIQSKMSLYFDHKISNHTFQSVSSLKIMSCILKAVEIHSFYILESTTEKIIL